MRQHALDRNAFPDALQLESFTEDNTVPMPPASSADDTVAVICPLRGQELGPQG